jgi:DNA polymerase-3 subunit beta
MKTLVPKEGDGRTEVSARFDRRRDDRVRQRRINAVFRIGQRLLTSRQLTGQFPNFEAVLPKDNSKSITAASDRTRSAISRVAQFADERSRAVRLKLEKGELKLSASSTETGESEDSIEARLQRRTLTIGFNAQYLIDFSKPAGHGEVKLELKDAQSAGQFRPAEGEDYKYRYIVMPMRI